MTWKHFLYYCPLWGECPSHWWFPLRALMIFMPLPLGARGIIFSGCLSIQPTLSMFFCPSICLPISLTNTDPFSVSVHTSIQRTFQAFPGKCIKGMAWNLVCRCILTPSEMIRVWSWFIDFPNMSRPPSKLISFWSQCIDFPSYFWHHLDHLKFEVSNHFLEIT